MSSVDCCCHHYDLRSKLLIEDATKILQLNSVEHYCLEHHSVLYLVFTYRASLADLAIFSVASKKYNFSYELSLNKGLSIFCLACLLQYY